MKYGRFRHKVTVQRPTITKDARGENVTIWDVVAKFLCEIITKSSDEDSKAMQVSAHATHLIKTRWVANLDVLPNDRLIYGSRIFDIVGVRNVDEYNRQIEIDIKEQL